MVSNSRKKASNRSMLFPLDRKLVSTRWNERFVEKYVSLDIKVISVTVMSVKKIGENGFN